MTWRRLVGIGEPLEVRHLPRRARELGGGDVEPRQAADAAADEVDETEGVQPPRIPAAKAIAAGATPNETMSASESRSLPSGDPFPVRRAMLPSSASMTNAIGKSAVPSQKNGSRRRS